LRRRPSSFRVVFGHDFDDRDFPFLDFVPFAAGYFGILGSASAGHGKNANIADGRDSLAPVSLGLV
jgi:hypothetical protein